MAADHSRLAAVVLAAGAGTRLRPLTTIRPKALCPVGNVPLVDLAIARARALELPVAVNVHHGRALMDPHLSGRVHLSIEEPHVLGTAGALGALRTWIAGRNVLILNADAWHPDDLHGLLDGWDGSRARLLTVTDPARGDFGTARYAGAALLPADVVAGFEAVPSGLNERCFRPMEESGRLELTGSDIAFFDCGTIADYHAANMASSDGANVVGEGAVVEGSIERTVLWPGARVAAAEVLVDAIRTETGLTVYASG